MGCLEALVPRPNDPQNVDVKIIDGAALIHSLGPRRSNATVKMFSDFAQKVFLPYIARQVQVVTRLDVIKDVYRPNSLKSQNREARGSGQANCAAFHTKIRSNWKTFL